MDILLSTKEVAQYLGVNEKMVYTLVAEKGLPASKVTGKWLFPQHLVDQWIEANTTNYPENPSRLAAYKGLLVIAGSNDPLLEQTVSLYNTFFPQNLAVFGNIGSMGGMRALKQNLCHIATSHMLQESDAEYNFEYAGQMLNPAPVVVNFCLRHQGLVVARGNPHRIGKTADLGRPGLRIINRKLGTGTRHLLDYELKAAGLNTSRIAGYQDEVQRHMDIGLAVLGGRADAGPCIQPVAEQLGLDFVPWRWERYDLLIPKPLFFDQAVQQFLGLLQDRQFQSLAGAQKGYDICQSGRMVFPQSSAEQPDAGRHMHQVTETQTEAEQHIDRS
jgi:putative molybdopterin biosynthesis protein